MSQRDNIVVQHSQTSSFWLWEHHGAPATNWTVAFGINRGARCNFRFRAAPCAASIQAPGQSSSEYPKNNHEDRRQSGDSEACERHFKFPVTVVLSGASICTVQYRGGLPGSEKPTGKFQHPWTDLSKSLSRRHIRSVFAISLAWLGLTKQNFTSLISHVLTRGRAADGSQATMSRPQKPSASSSPKSCPDTPRARRRAF